MLGLRCGVGAGITLNHERYVHGLSYQPLVTMPLITGVTALVTSP